MLSRIKELFSSSRYSNYSPLISHYGATSNDTNPKLPQDATKIEPKVFFASERTFLTWLRVAVLISTFALALFNSAQDGNYVAKGMGLIYALLAILIIAYARYMHSVRRIRIIGRFAGHHDEPYGPLFLCVAIFLAVLLNFFLRVQQRERLAGVPSPKNPWLTTVVDQLQFAFTLPSRSL